MRDSDTPYVFSNMRGREVSHVGSGWVKAVTGPSCCSTLTEKHPKYEMQRHIERTCSIKSIKRYETCPRVIVNQDKCDVAKENVLSQKRKLSSCEKERSIWTIWILTAKHIIYDNTEAICSHVAFFDDLDGIDTEWKSVDRCEFYDGNTEEDWSLLRCDTEDQLLADRIRQTAFKCNEFAIKLDKALDTIPLNHCDPIPRMVVVISHPHGKKKYLSIGDFRGSEGWAVKYTAGTCNGSSGGLVLNIGRKISYRGNTTLSSSLPHSGAVSEEIGISAAWKGCVRKCNVCIDHVPLL